MFVMRQQHCRDTCRLSTMFILDKAVHVFDGMMYSTHLFTSKMGQRHQLVHNVASALAVNTRIMSTMFSLDKTDTGTQSVASKTE